MKIKEMILKVENNKQLIKKYTEENKKYSDKIIEKLKSKNLKKYIMQDDDYALNTTLIEKNNLQFDLDKLEEKLTKKQFKEVTETKVEVNKAILKEIFKKNSEIKKIVKPALIITRELNENKLKKLIDKGEIKGKTIKDTYTITKSNYLRIERKSLED